MKSGKSAASKNAGNKIGVRIQSGVKDGKLSANHTRASLEVMSKAPGTPPRKWFGGPALGLSRE